MAKTTTNAFWNKAVRRTLKTMTRSAVRAGTQAFKTPSTKPVKRALVAANMQGCWNWFDTRTGRAQREADSIDATIEQVCQKHPVDPQRIALAGLSAGASLATLMAMRHPWRYRAVATHSGVPPGAASSNASALSAMRGRRAAIALAPLTKGHHLPPLLVIQGNLDALVAPGNGTAAAGLWATCEGAKSSTPRTVQRGARYGATVTDFKTRGRLVTTLCLVNGLGHAWSGGAAGLAYSDPKGPDASRMIWAFAVKAFARSEATRLVNRPTAVKLRA